VDAVATVAAALGMTAAPTKVHAGWWRHEATENGDGYGLAVHTDITGPQVCACGAVCSHRAVAGVGS
jgi:hypothetical protein